MTASALAPVERLQRCHDRLSCLSSMLWATAAGDALRLTDTELRALAGYLEDVRDDVDVVLAAEYSADLHEPGAPGALTPAEKRMIAHLHSTMPATDLLAILNERILASQDARFPLGRPIVTLKQLQSEISRARS